MCERRAWAKINCQFNEIGVCDGVVDSDNPTLEKPLNVRDIDSAYPPRLSEDLRRLLVMAQGHDLSLAEIEAILQGRGIAVVILIIAIPFAMPIPNPTSMLFGAAIMFMSLRLIFSQRSWLPTFILNKKIPHAVIEKVVVAGIRIFEKLERFVRPRLHFVHGWPAMKALIGVGIMVSAFIMSLPFFVPNAIPALAIIFLTIGLMEEDGVLVLVGYFLGLVSAAFLAMVYFLGFNGVSLLMHKFFH